MLCSSLLLAAAGVAAAPDPAVPAWTAPRPDPALPLGGFSRLPYAQPISLVYAATTEADGLYNHNVFLGFHPGGRFLFTYWKNGVLYEDKPGQRELISFSEDGGKTWSGILNGSRSHPPQVLFPNMTTPGREAVMFGAPPLTLGEGRRVYAAASPGYYNRSKSDVHVAQGAQCALWPDSLDPRNCGPAQSYAVEYHQTLLMRRINNDGSLGPLFWASERGPPALFEAATAALGILSLTDTDADTQADIAILNHQRGERVTPPGCDPRTDGVVKCEWCPGPGCQQFADIPWSLGITNERSVYRATGLMPGVTADSIAHVYHDIILYRDSKTSLYASSRPVNITDYRNSTAVTYGSWSPTVITDIPNDSSNINTGLLPDGRIFLTGNPVTRGHSTMGRDPLTLATSKDGGWTFDSCGVVCTCNDLPVLPARRAWTNTSCVPAFNHSVNHGPSYPQLLSVVAPMAPEDFIGTYVAFSNNKEDIYVVKLHPRGF